MEASIGPRPPRLLLLTSAYFLLGELVVACERAGVPHRLLDLAAREMDRDAFVALVRGAVKDFRPDCLVTVNHLGVDREGVLCGLLGDLGLPLVSWFVDNPEYILPLYPRPDAATAARTLVLSWDLDSLDAVRELGYPRAAWLPLGVDEARFRPGRAGRAAWKAEVGFVGNSMLAKTAARLNAARPTPALLEAFVPLAGAFAAWPGRGLRGLVAATRPELLPELDALPVERRTAYETAVVWRATLGYRLDCVARLLAFDALIAGDAGWAELLSGAPGLRLHPEIGYYEEAPEFYASCAVNFNCTSVQMKGAVNQRVFDVPASGAFLLTDARAQLALLFEPGREVAVYQGPEEIPELLARALADAPWRARVAGAGRARVLAEHTYAHRLAALLRLADEHFPERGRASGQGG